MKLSRLSKLVAFIFAVLILVACGGATSEPAPSSSRSEQPEADPTESVMEPTAEPQVYTIGDVCTAVNNSLVTVTGELELPSFISSFGNQYGLNFAQSDSRIRVEVGDGANQMQDIPDEYAFSDLIVQTEDGQTVGHGDAVTVTGVITTNDTGGCSINAATIESASVADIVWPAAETRSIDDVCTAAEGSWVAVTGPLALPSLLSATGGRYSLDLRHSDARARFKIGTGVNQMRDVPDDYQLDDLIIETMDGTLIGQGDPATVQGVLTLYSEGCSIEVATVSVASWSDIEWPKFNEVSVAEACTQADGSWVRVIGQLDLPAFVSGFSGTYYLNLLQSDNPDVSIRVSVPIGDGANEIRPLPDEYALTDLQIETIDGVMLTHGDMAAVMGPVIAGDDGNCILDVVEVNSSE